MRRGFKSEAERQAEGLRSHMGLKAIDPITPEQVAAHLGVEIRNADDLVPIKKLKELYAIQPDAFSAATFRLPGGRTVIVHNPLHAEGRVRSNLAHELAHLMLEHDTRQVGRVGDMSFFTCDAVQEEEANWLAACLLLPRALLLRDARSGLGAPAIALRHGVSEPMARFRLNASGVLIQVARAKSRKSSGSVGLTR